MRPLYLVDLDDTLFQTNRKMTDAQRVGATIASTLEDGSPSGYRTLRQQHFMELLKKGDVVPVTARDRSVMARVEVPQAPAICSNGGVIIDSSGHVDRKWHDEITSHIGNGEKMRGIHDAISQAAGPMFRNWIVEDDELELYIVFKHNGSDDMAITDLKDLILREQLSEGWDIHSNGNNLSVLPPWISKRKAVRYVIGQTRAKDPERLIIGAGDSRSDLAFMMECDFAIIPTQSQIAKSIGGTIS